MKSPRRPGRHPACLSDVHTPSGTCREGAGCRRRRGLRRRHWSVSGARRSSCTAAAVLGAGNAAAPGVARRGGRLRGRPMIVPVEGELRKGLRNKSVAQGPDERDLPVRKRQPAGTGWNTLECPCGRNSDTRVRDESRQNLAANRRNALTACHRHRDKRTKLSGGEDWRNAACRNLPPGLGRQELVGRSRHSRQMDLCGWRLGCRDGETSQAGPRGPGDESSARCASQGCVDGFRRARGLLHRSPHWRIPRRATAWLGPGAPATA